jgi:hypothetical protein
VPTEAEADRWFADEARRQLDTLRRRARDGEWFGAGSFANAYAELRDTSETLQWFDSMLVHRDPPVHNIPNDPDFDFLRDDPRYQAWEAKLPWSRRGAAPVRSPAEEQSAAPQ